MSSPIVPQNISETLSNPTPATLFAFATGSEDCPPDLVNEEEIRMELLGRQMGVLQHWKSRQELNTVVYETAARYMPQLYETWKRSTSVHNPVLSLWGLMAHAPYYARFFTRTPAGPEALGIQVDRLLTATITRETHSADHIAELGQWLSTMIALVGVDAFQAKVKSGDDAEGRMQTMERKLRDMMSLYPGRLAEGANERCLQALTGDWEMTMMMTAMHETLTIPLEVCGLKSCQERRPEKLKQCSRCKTAVFCCVAHQKSAWPKHKPDCFPPSF